MEMWKLSAAGKLQIEACAAHPFAQNAKGWGTLRRNSVTKNKAHKVWATRPAFFVNK